MPRKPKKVYLDFEEYAKNDPDYFIRCLSGDLNKYQRRIMFADGSSYNVTKTGNRYWRYVDFYGEYVGFKGEHTDGNQYWFCYLNTTHYYDEYEFWKEVHFLTE